MPQIVHGKPVRISERVQRITAPNEGVMTGPGTNSYIIGTDELALVDPGPCIESHIDAMLKATASRLKWILVTHTHRDHSPAALPIAQATGAKLVGNIIPNDGFQDETFQGAMPLKNDEVISNKEYSIRALLTPGHVSNHICYLVEEDKILITGDHMMQGSTVVIVPPAGSMKDYIDSLKRIQTYDVNYVAPGHGDLIGEPNREIMRLIDHRLKREKKVQNALTSARQATIDELVPVVYDDVDQSLHKWAALSLHAHLIKLEIEQSVTKNGDSWTIN